MRLRKFKLNKISILFFFIIGLIFIQVLIFAPGSVENSDSTLTKSQIQQMAFDPSNKKSVDQKMHGVHLVENVNNLKGWELFADEADGTSNEQWVLKKVKVEFYSENQSSYIVTGEVGEIDGQTKNLKIRGQVVTQSSNGYQFVTNDLIYDAKKKQLYSDDSVEMLGPEDAKGRQFKLNGRGFLIEVETNKMYIQKEVEAYKELDNKVFHINSNRAEFSNKNQEALFLDNVKMTFNSSLLTAPQALFKYSEKLKTLEKITLSDRVTLKDADKMATCRELEMLVVQDEMILRGQPKVQMGDDEIQGHEISFLAGGKKVKINKAQITGSDLKVK